MKILTTVAIAALLLTGCAKKNDTPEAIKQGVVRDLAGKFDMSKMDVVVDSVSFRDKEADATVTFMAKGGSPDQGMSMQYVMERHDDNQWYIKSRASAQGAGGASGAAAGHGGAGEMADPAETGGSPSLPPGHPVTGQSQ